MRPIFLIGYMCSGKTTLGEALARALSIPFVDLDHYVESLVGKSVCQIFDSEGEDAFRRYEQSALADIIEQGRSIVACGGGTPCHPGAMALMRAAGTVVYLRPNMDRLVQRMIDGRHKRPLIAHIDSAEQMRQMAESMIATREPYYTQAHAVFDSSLLECAAEIDQSVQALIEMLASHDTN